jgi:hypothetical protein
MLLYLDSCCFNRPFDALHTAAAESAGCNYLVTTDDDLIKKSKRHQSQLMISFLNPIDIISLP